jgi:hypothetical protein
LIGEKAADYAFGQVRSYDGNVARMSKAISGKPRETRMSRCSCGLLADGQITEKPVQPSPQKHFHFSLDPNQFITRAVSSHQEGRLAIATNAGRDAVDADALLDEQRVKRTAKSYGPDASTLASSWREVSGR